MHLPGKDYRCPNELLHTNTESTETLLQTKQQVSYSAVLSLILSVLSILVIYMSIHKIETIHHRALYSCIAVSQTPVYTVVHNLCSILPTVSIIFGILALMRIAHSRGKLCGKFLAIEDTNEHELIFKKEMFWFC